MKSKSRSPSFSDLNLHNIINIEAMHVMLLIIPDKSVLMKFISLTNDPATWNLESFFDSSNNRYSTTLARTKYKLFVMSRTRIGGRSSTLLFSTVYARLLRIHNSNLHELKRKIFAYALNACELI